MCAITKSVLQDLFLRFTLDTATAFVCVLLLAGRERFLTGGNALTDLWLIHRLARCQTPLPTRHRREKPSPSIGRLCPCICKRTA